MKSGTNPKNRQRGAVAVMVGIGIVLLVGFLAMVMDLSRVYLARTGLQNAADAAALSGARQLDGTAAGICCDPVSGNSGSAVAWARRTGGDNTFFGGDLSQVQVDIGPLDTSNTKVTFSNSPDGPWVDISAAQASPGDKFFIKVDTESGAIAPLFAVVWDFFNMGTFGMAVAGPIVMNTAPLGVCAIDVALGPPRVCGGPGSECGFLRGVAYNVPELNPIGLQAHPLLVNPVDVPPGSCDPNHTSADFMRPFICQGKAVTSAEIPGEIYANTGGSWGPVAAGLNSRFDIFGGAGQCDPATAPPDINIKSYAFGGSANQGRPRDWMNPDPTRQGITIDPLVHKPQGYPARLPIFDQWGVLWSYARERNWATGSDYALSDWPALYGGSADTGADGYPATGTPYQATTGKYFQAPSPSHPGKADRRVLNLLIVDCDDPAYPVPGPGAACATVKVLGIGKFFMQVPADSSGSPKKLHGEFAGLLPASLFKKQYILYQ